jgi:hypothetical protein
MQALARHSGIAFNLRGEILSGSSIEDLRGSKDACRFDDSARHAAMIAARLTEIIYKNLTAP